MSNPKQNRFLHSLPEQPAAPVLKLPAPAVIHPPAARPPVVTPRMMPVPGQKHAGPPPNRWNRLQEYLQKAGSPAPSPVAPPTGQEPPEE